MADKKLTVAEMLAAARKADAQGGAAETPQADAPAEGAAAPAKPAAPAAKTPVSAGGARPSVADMLAMARGGGVAPAAPKEKPAAKPAAAKAAPTKKEAPAAKSEPVDTQSILAAARKTTKPGPMTKAEAQAKASPAAPDAKKAKAKEAIVVPPMPVKPAYAKPGALKAAKDAAVTERRAFIFGMSALAVGFTALSATAAAWTLGTVRFMFPNILREPPSKFSVGTTDKFSPGQVETRFKAQFGVWIVNTEYNGQQEIFALKSVCTHLGCTPNWLDAEQKFKCPCHGSGYYKDGINFEGPAPRPLERYAISIGSDGSIEVDKSRTFQQEMGDWDNPACYIPV
ncbi:MAG TPA: ubiquinol-cytochrome c reductase iron-sulfur subunit [Lacipirellulaceae bacterium]|jgi:cytochrome b6-f complex iron-sulfur subunit|nr:ubiquinol-cytochrome c reductase iron-sulfur subunit [Lacipirellulaceae bacterium]